MKTIVGNKKAVEYLEMAVTSHGLSHAYLFSGPISVGKTTMALEMARVLLCSNGAENGCSCASCRKVELRAHPDLHFMEGSESGIDEVREIVRQIEMSPYQSKYRVAVIAHAEKLTIPALNSFLKTLEEPKENTILILTTENRNTLLPTIVSRTRKVAFGTVSEKMIFTHLNQEVGVKKDLAASLATLASGRIGMAISMAEAGEDASTDLKEGENFLRIYGSESISDKISYAATMVNDKEGLGSRLVHVTAVIRKFLLAAVSKGKEQEVLMTISALDGLAKAEELLMKNINSKLVIESLLFRSL